MTILVGELVDLGAELVEVAVEGEVRLHDILPLPTQRGDVLGQVRDHPLYPLQLRDASPVLGDQPTGSCLFMLSFSLT